MQSLLNSDLELDPETGFLSFDVYKDSFQSYMDNRLYYSNEELNIVNGVVTESKIANGSVTIDKLGQDVLDQF